MTRVGQLSLDDLGTPLTDVTFVVVDLETTGGSPHDGGITEIGAVAVRGGDVIAEFATLVNADQPIPAMVQRLTGISTHMLTDAPNLTAALSSFWEFAQNAVLVAHNAPYDIGFLRGAGVRIDWPWPDPTVIDTVTLARRLLVGGEVVNHKLSTLARYFNSPIDPVHRALADARATVNVLHGLFERLGPLGVSNLEDLLAFSRTPHPVQQRKRALADNLPELPGVYVFRDKAGRPLYVGKSTSLRTRVRSYFSAAQPRARMKDMLHQAESITPIVCATPLEAAIREIRLIGEHQPPFNRRSRNPQRGMWIALSEGKSPRLTVTCQISARHTHAIGPISSRHQPREALAALAYEPAKPGELPCTSDSVSATATTTLQADATAQVATIRELIDRLVSTERFEQARLWRDRLAALLWGIESAHTLASLGANAQVTAGKLIDRTWHLHVIRYGRLAAAGAAQPGTDPRPVLDALIAIAEDTPSNQQRVIRPAGLIEEARLIWRWLLEPGTRIVTSAQPFASSLTGGGDTLHRLRIAQKDDQSLLAELDRLSEGARPMQPAPQQFTRRTGLNRGRRDR
ncbi:MAG: DEDD exonuclease domain-containing protein [Candidatus Nanopelagicales bacterium]